MLLKFLGKYRDCGLLFLRIGLGIMFCLHGLPKLHGGPKVWISYGHAIGNLGIHFLPVFWGFMAAVTECIGGILLALGFFYRPICLMLTFTMAVAFLKLHHDRMNFQEYSRPLEMAFVFFAMALIGSGSISIDKD